MTLPLFDLAESQKRKEIGQQLAATANQSDLEIARSIAREICRRVGTVTADDVGQVLKQRHGIKSLGPVAGSLFKTGEFEHTGDYRKSKRVKNHARLLFVWRLKVCAEN